MLAALLLGPPGATQAQETRTIQGIVRDSATGETLPFAQISIRDTDIFTTSNRGGYFAIVNAPPGEFVLRVVYMGYTPLDITVPPYLEEARLNVGMVRAPLRLETVEVTAERIQVVEPEERVSTVRLSPTEIAMLPSIGEVDIFRSLQLLPGISGTKESSSGLYVRGGTPDQNLVLLDGMTVYHVDHFFGFFSAFNAEAVKDVHFYKGGFPAQYGGRVSSVVDLTGKTGDPLKPHVVLGLSLLSGNVAAQLPLFGKGSVLISARRSYTDIMRTGLYSSIFDVFNAADSTPTQPDGPGGRGGLGGLGGRFGNASFSTTQPDFYFYDVNSKITYRPSELDVVSVSLYNGQDYLDDSRFQTRDVTGQNADLSRFITSDITDWTDWGNMGMSSAWARQWHPRIYTNLLVAYSRYFSDHDRTTAIETRDTDADTLLMNRSMGTFEANEVDDLSVRFDNEWQVFSSHKVDFGGWLSRSEVDYNFTRDDTLDVLDRHQEGLTVAGYLQDTWNIGSAFSLTLGGRITYYDQTEQTYLEPRISTSLALTDRLKLKGAFGQYNQFVTRVVNENVTEGSRDFWLLADGDLVDVTSSDHYVVGASYETSGYLFDAELYRKDLYDLSEFSLRYQRARQLEIENLFFEGAGMARGVELLAQKKFGSLTGWASYTLSEVEHTFPDLNDGEPFAALHDQTHEFKIVSMMSLGRLNLSGTWVFATGTPYTAPESEYAITLLDGTQQSYVHVGDKNGLRLPDYHRLDLAAHYRFPLGRWVGDIGLSVFNLYDRTNVWYREFDLSESPMLITDATYLGLTPSLSVRFEF
jgi:hypothetical protein